MSETRRERRHLNVHKLYSQHTQQHNNTTTHRFGQRRKLISLIPKVLVLKDCTLPVFGTLEALDSAVLDLRYWVRSYGVWGVQSSPENPIDSTVFDKIISIFNMLDDLLFWQDGEINNGAGAKYHPLQLPTTSSKR